MLPIKWVFKTHDSGRPSSEGGEFEERYWSVVNSPLLDENNNVNYIIQLVEDVTETKSLSPTTV
jgi:hypothetical protein